MSDLTPRQRAAADSIEGRMRAVFVHPALDAVALRNAAELSALRIDRDAQVIEGGRVPFEVFVTHNADGTSEVEVRRHGLTFERKHVSTLGDCGDLALTLTSRRVDEATADRQALAQAVAR